MYRCFLTIIVLLSVMGLSDLAWSAGPSGFTQADRERLVRLEAILETFMKATDKRFEQVDKRFEQMMNFMWILASIFAAMTVANIGFAYWDRRTIIRKAVDESVAGYDGGNYAIRSINGSI